MVQSTFRIRTHALNRGKKNNNDQQSLLCKLGIDIAAILTLNNNQSFIQPRSTCVSVTFLKSSERFTR